jgi:hypothetical protein
MIAMNVELFLLGSIGIIAYILGKDYYNSVKLKKYLRDAAEGKVKYDYVSAYSSIIKNLSGPFTGQLLRTFPQYLRKKR